MNYKNSGAIAARIENLGRLNDRRLKANESGDIIELEKVARDYELLKHPAYIMAREIRIAINIRKQRQHATVSTTPEISEN